MENVVDLILADASLDKRFILDFPYRYFVDSIRLSHSTLQTYDSCPRKFEFTKLYQNPKHSDSLAASFGSALHIGFQEYLITGDYNRAVYKMMLAYPWEYGESPMKDRSAEGALALLDEMIKQFPSERFELAYINVNGEVKPCVEVPFLIRFKGYEEVYQPSLVAGQPPRSIAITYVGFMDLVLFDKDEDRYIVVDIKTTADSAIDQSPKYRYSDQCVPYGLVLNKILGLASDDLSIGYYVANPSIASPRATMIYFYKSKEDLLDWQMQMVECLDSLKKRIELGWFPRTRSGCLAYKRVCPFYEYCQDRDSKRTQLQLAYSGEREEIKPFEPWVDVTIDLSLGDSNEYTIGSK